MKKLDSILLSLILVVLIIGVTTTHLKVYSDSTETETKIIMDDKEYHNFLDLIVDGQAVRLDMENSNDIVQFYTLNVENDITVLISGNDNFEVTFDGGLRTLGDNFIIEF